MWVEDQVEGRWGWGEVIEAGGGDCRRMDGVMG